MMYEAIGTYVSKKIGSDGSKAIGSVVSKEIGNGGSKEIGSDVSKDWKRHIGLGNHGLRHLGKGTIFPIHQNHEKTIEHILCL